MFFGIFLLSGTWGLLQKR